MSKLLFFPKKEELVSFKFFIKISILFVLLISVEYSVFKYISNQTFTTSRVYNVSDQKVFIDKNPKKILFGYQGSNSPNIVNFREKMGLDLDSSLSDLEKAVAIRKWGRSQQKQFGCGGNSDNPLQLLMEQRDGAPGACRRFGVILMTALAAEGFKSRLVAVTPDFNDDSFNHTLVEVWIPSLDKWVLIDSTYDTFYYRGEKPASLFEVFSAIRDGRGQEITFDDNGSKTPKASIIIGSELSKLGKSFRHIYVAINNAFADGYSVKNFFWKRVAFIHYFDEKTPPHPNSFKNILLLVLAINSIALVFVSYSMSCLVLTVSLNTTKKYLLAK